MLHNNTSRFFLRFSILGIIICLYLISAIYFPRAYIQLTYEDLYGEWAQTLFFVVAAFYSGRLAYYQSQYRTFFGLLAVACFYVFMEEISWGQRLFGLTTPDFFKQNNLQKEMNLHNLLTGPVKSDTKFILEYLISIALIAYGLIYPFLLQYKLKIACFVKEKLKIPSPPFYLAPYFVLAAILEPEPFSFNEAEIAELLVGISLTFLSIHYYFEHLNRLNDSHSDTLWQPAIQTRYKRTLLGISILVFGCSFIIGQWSMQSAHMGKLIKQRLNSGYVKFARRYESYKQWETANTLLKYVVAKNKPKPAILRKIAKNYHRLGDSQGFSRYKQQAILLDLQQSKDNVQPIIHYLSLSKSFRKKANTKQANHYAQKAYELALSRASKKLSSANRAYWLGKTMANRDMHESAYLQFKKAKILKPNNIVFRRAYVKQQQRIKAIE